MCGEGRDEENKVFFPADFPLIRLVNMLKLQTSSHILETILQYPMW